MAVELSGDKVGIEEIVKGVDIHRTNQQLFKLPGWDINDKENEVYKAGRLLAKTFLFRLIFGGSAYSYAHDPEFASVSTSEKYWQNIIDTTYAKYKGLAQWHKDLVKQVTLTGKITAPSGREFHYKPEMKRGELKWPRTTILNYVDQGFSADLVMIARVSSWRRLEEPRKQGKVIFFNTVHDDIELDVANDPQLLYDTSVTLEQVFQDVPANVKKIYGYEMKVPLAGEVSFGNNLGKMQEFHKEKGIEQFL